MVVAFFIPFNSIPINNLSLVLWIGYCFYINHKSILSINNSIWFSLLPVILFCLNLFSLFRCADLECRSKCLSFLERHILFAIFPLLFLASSVYQKGDIKKVLESFAWGTAVQVVFYLAPTFEIVHYPYLGMFSVFSFSYCLATYIQEKKIRHILLSLFLLVLIVLIKAKLALGLIGIITLVILFRHGKMKLFYLCATLIIFGLTILWSLFSSSIQSIFAIKTYTWNCALMAYFSSQEYVFGVGIGDSEKMLVNVYQQYPDWIGYMGYNAHNQFIETLLAHGMLGLTILIAWLLYGLLISIRNGNEFLCYFIVILFFSFQTESMLWRQKGILFTVFFFVILLKESGLRNLSMFTGKRS
jgi:hypothetical protein